jgi:hypothetical protein
MTEESIRLSFRTKNFINTFGLTSSTQYYLLKVLPSRFYLKGSTFFIDSGPEKEKIIADNNIWFWNFS